MSVLIPTTSDLTRILDNGSDAGYWRIINDLTGAGADEYAPMPVRANFEFSPNQSENKKVTEGRNSVTTSTSFDWMLKIMTDQAGVTELFVFPDLVEGKILQIIMELNNQKIGGMYAYIMLLGKMIKRPDVKPKNTTEYDFRLYTAASTINQSMTNLLFPNFKATFSSSTLSIAATKYYGTLESA